MPFHNQLLLQRKNLYLIRENQRLNLENLQIKMLLNHLRRKLKKRRKIKIRIQYLVRMKKKKKRNKMLKNLHKLVIELLLLKNKRK